MIVCVCVYAFVCMCMHACVALNNPRNPLLYSSDPESSTSQCVHYGNQFAPVTNSSIHPSDVNCNDDIHGFIMMHACHPYYNSYIAIATTYRKD